MLFLINTIINPLFLRLKGTVVYFELVLWLPVQQLALVQMRLLLKVLLYLKEEKLVKTLVSWFVLLMLDSEPLAVSRPVNLSLFNIKPQ